MLYEHHKHSKVVLPNVIFGQIKTTNYDLSIHNRSTLKLVRPQTILGEIKTVHDLSALYQVGFSHSLSMRGQHGNLGSKKCSAVENAIQKVMASHSNQENLVL